MLSVHYMYKVYLIPPKARFLLGKPEALRNFAPTILYVFILITETCVTVYTVLNQTILTRCDLPLIRRTN